MRKHIVLMKYIIRLKATWYKDNNEGNARYKSKGIDMMTLRYYNIIKFRDDDGNIWNVESNESSNIPSEIMWLLKSPGY